MTKSSNIHFPKIQKPSVHYRQKLAAIFGIENLNSCFAITFKQTNRAISNYDTILKPPKPFSIKLLYKVNAYLW